MNVHLAKYPRDAAYGNYFHDTPLEDRLWELADEKEFLSSFNTLASNKRVYTVELRDYSLHIVKEAEKFLEKYY